MSEPSGIGQFVIGVSPIGTQPPFDYTKTILSQYANSPRLITLIESFNESIDQTRNLDAFYDSVWNIQTATGYGLDVWGRIVGVVRVLQVADVKYFGFNEAGTTGADPWNQSPFYNGGPLTGNFVLSDSAFRQLIFAKALFNICDGTVKAINNLLMLLFPNMGNCYVEDLGGMTMTYHFSQPLTPVQSAIVFQSGVLPRPVGVLATVITP